MAQTAEEALVVRMEATLGRFEAQMRRAQGLTNRTAKGMEDRLAQTNQRISASADKAAQSVARIGGGNTGMLQNVSFQLQDFAVQVAAGTSASQALGQQLPQLLSGFGALGAVVGVAVAVGVPLASMLIGSAEKAVTLDEAIKGVTQASSDYYDAVDQLLTPLGDMYVKFGQNAEAAREVQQVMYDIARVRLADSIAKVSEGIQSELSSLISLVEEYRQIQATDAQPDSGFQYDAAAAQAEIIAEIREEWAMTYVEAQRVAEAISAMETAQQSGDAQALASAFVEVSAALSQALDNGISLTEEQLALMDAVANAAIEQQRFAAHTADAAGSAAQVASADIAGNVGAGADQAGRLASNMADAAASARLLAAQRALSTAGEVSSGRGGDPRTSSQQGYGEFGRDTLDEIIASETRRAGGGGGGRKRGGGGGGGKKSADGYAESVKRLQQQIDMMRAETTAFQEASGAVVQYGDAADYAKKKAELLIAAQKDGKAITPELSAEIDKQALQYAKVAAEAENAKNKINEMQRQSQRGQDALNDVFGAMLEGADSAKDALANLLMEMAKIQLQRGLMTILDGAGGGGLASWIGSMLSFDGGGSTGRGPRSGGVDGKGGFMAVLHPNETVVDHTKGQSVGGSAAVHVTVSASEYFDARVDRRIGSGISQAQPTIVRNAVQATGRTMGRTKQFGGRL